jgi:hypothetical protein
MSRLQSTATSIRAILMSGRLRTAGIYLRISCIALSVLCE